MLRSTFKSFQPASLFIILPVLLAGLWIPQFINPPVYSDTYSMPLFMMLEQVNVLSNTLGLIIGFILVYAQAMLLNGIVNRYEVFDQRTSMVALVFALAISSIPDLRSLHPVHPAGLFILAALYRLFAVYRQITAYSAVFDAGLLLGIASLFYLPALLMFPVLWIFLIVMRPFIWREYALALTGLALPYLFAGTFYFLFDRGTWFFSELIWQPIVERVYNFFVEDRALLVLLWFMAGLLAISIFSFVGLMGKSIVRSQNLQLTFTWLFLVSAGAVVQTGVSAPSDFALVAIPFSIPVSWFLISIRKGWISELLLFSWIVLIVFQSYW